MDKRMWFTLPDFRWMSFEGDRIVDVLNGLVTNDVARLQPDTAMYAAALAPKGKLLSDLWLVRSGEALCHAGATESAFTNWKDIVRKYVNPRLCRYRDISESSVTFLVVAQHVESGQFSALGATVTSTAFAGAAPSFFIIAPAEHSAQCRALLQSEYGEESDGELLRIMRIEAGRPQWGIDMDENTLVQEANLDQLDAVSYNKGCYTGQETVARVHFRGHVNRHLRGLRSSELLVRGLAVQSHDGNSVGDVRSSATSPLHGPIALAMIRREVAAGSTVDVVDEAGAMSIPATVHELPFVAGQ